MLVAALLVVTIHQAAPAAQQREAAPPRSQVIVTVADSSGGQVANAAVRVSRGREAHTATVGPDGTVRLLDLAPGEWTLMVTSAGFIPKRQSLVIQSGLVQVAVVLEVAGVRESVQVVATAPPNVIGLEAPATGGTMLDIPVRDLPASLSLVTQQAIQERGARSTIEAAELAVGIVGGSFASIPSYATRGFSGNSITLMRDGIRQNTASQSSRPLDAFVFERIEVLKGPSSVLYGEGAVGAALNFVSKEPRRKFGVDGLASYGAFGSSRVGIGLTGPLEQKVSVRLDASYSKTDGYIDRSDQKLGSFAGALDWTPSAAFRLRAAGTYGYDSSTSYYGTPLIDGRIDLRTRNLNYNMLGNLAKSRNSWGRLNADVRVSNAWTLRNEAWVTVHGLDWRNFESYTYNATTKLIDVGSYFLIWRDDIMAGDRFLVRGDLNLFGRPVRLTTGLDLQHKNMLRGGLSDPSIRFSVDPFDPKPIVDPGRPYVRDRDVLVDDVAGFGETMVEVTERLKVVAGLRWERIALDYTVPPGGTASGNGPGVSGNQNYYPTTGRAGVVWAATPGMNVYGSFSRAVEPVNQLVFLSGAQQTFSLTPGRQWEFGTKATALGGRMDATLAYFDIEKRDILTASIVNGQTFAQQIGRQIAHGVELSVATRPTARLRVTGDVALTHAEFADFTEIFAGGNVSRDGNLPPNVPESVLSLWASQQLGPFDVSGTARHVGRIFADNANLAATGHYTTLDAAASYRLSRGCRLAVRGRNLTDELYAVRAVSGGAALRLEAPRSFDVEFSVRF